MKQFWLVAAAALLLVTLLPDGAFAQRRGIDGGFRGGAIGGGFRGAAIGGGFRGAAIGGGFRPGAAIGGSRLPRRRPWHGPRRRGGSRLPRGRDRQGLARRRSRPRFPRGRNRQGRPRRRLSRRRLGTGMEGAPRMGLGLAGRSRLWAWRVELSLLRLVLRGSLPRVEWLCMGKHLLRLLLSGLTSAGGDGVLPARCR